MITAIATGDSGEIIITFGVSRDNIERLTAGQPIRVTAESHAGFPENLKILIFFGETERDCVKQLEPLMGKETKVVGIPRDKQRPQ